MNEQRWNLNLSMLLFLILSELFERVKNLALQCCGGGQISGCYYSILQTIFPPPFLRQTARRDEDGKALFFFFFLLLFRVSPILSSHFGRGGGPFLYLFALPSPFPNTRQGNPPPEKVPDSPKQGGDSKLISSSICKISCKFVFLELFYSSVNFAFLSRHFFRPTTIPRRRDEKSHFDAVWHGGGRGGRGGDERESPPLPSLAHLNLPH